MQATMQRTPRNENRTPAVLGVSVLLFLSLFRASPAACQEPPKEPMAGAQAQIKVQPPQAKASLAEMVQEAERNNPQIQAARHAWKAATQVPSQVSTLPDPEFTVQQFSVGSPRPFAGYTNSEFAYIGIGVSQDFPYPGKLRLRGEIAERDAASAQERVEAVRRSVVEQLKTTYFRLSYIQQTLGILERDDKLLEQIEKIAQARYRVGQGIQADVLKAQVERTKLLREIAHHHQVMGELEAQLKQILNRRPDSPDIATEELTETALPYSSDELLRRVRTQNPEVASEQEMVRKQGLKVELAHKDFYPDFNLQYMWQRTDPTKFRAYYMLTFGMRIPIHRRGRQQPELAQATEELNRSQREYEASVQQAYFDVRDQFVTADTAAQLLKIYREGLIPQATATFQAGLAAYQSNREDFQTLLSSFLDVLNFDIDYWRALADHESALAHIERLTGVTLP